MAETRYCSNCRTEIPSGADTCPQCGVFAGDVFDGQLPRKSRRGLWTAVFVAILVATAAVGWLILQRRAEPAAITEPQPIAVVSDRPGGSRRASDATINEAEAIRVLRRHFLSKGIAADCVVISSQGPAGDVYRLTAINRCDGTRLGRFVVEGKTQGVSAGR